MDHSGSGGGGGGPSSVRDSKRDLISEEGMSTATGRSSTVGSSVAAALRRFKVPPVFQTTAAVRALAIAAAVLILSLMIALIVVCENYRRIVPPPLPVSDSEASSHMSPAATADDICLTPGCIAAAHMVLENMEPSVDPCINFYEFACGGFEKRVVIPDDKSSRTQFAIIGDNLLEQLRAILEGDEDDKENSSMDSSRVFDMARNVYKACMDEERIEATGLAPLLDMLETLGGWPVLDSPEQPWNETAFDWMQTVFRFRRHGYSTDYLVDFSVVTDSRNSTSRVIDIDQASLGMSREYLINGLDDKDVASYYTYMVNVATLLGAPRDKAEKELKESLMFEIQLAKISQARENRRNATRMYNPMLVGDLHTLAPIIPWTEYINNILTEKILQIDETERVIVDEPGYLVNLTRLLPTVPKRTLANYMMWRAARASLDYFTESARKIQLEFAKNITGKKSGTERWKICTGTATGSFASPAGSMYVRKHFKEEAKEAMREMVKDIRQQFDSILDTIDWMDEKTRQRAKGKLASMREYIGYPEEILINEKLEEVYKDLHIGSESHFHNGINMSIWGTDYAWSKLREKVDKTDWKRHGAPAVVNAFYSSIENSIQFPAGILQGNFFESDRPAYMNYGGIGWVIGHEITHGFDDQGRQYDEEGNLANWWEEETKNRFLEKANCIIWQYGNYTAESVNKTLNGINTQGENIADNGGIKEAYQAYRTWVGRHGREKRLPGLQQYNPYQMFWISAANTWCSKHRAKDLENRIRTGAHSPGMFRVRGPFANSREFAADFHCPLGSRMNPAAKCEVW